MNADHHNFIAAARDFANAGRDKFNPGYDQYCDLLTAAEALAADCSASADGGGEKRELAEGFLCEADDHEFTISWPGGSWLVAFPDGKIVVGASPAETPARSLTMANLLRPTPEREANAGEGWIIGNGDSKLWRTWESGQPEWTAERDKATRYARREDAENVHTDDEDAWFVIPFASSSSPAEGGE